MTISFIRSLGAAGDVIKAFIKLGFMSQKPTPPYNFGITGSYRQYIRRIVLLKKLRVFFVHNININKSPIQNEFGKSTKNTKLLLFKNIYGII